MRWLKAACLFVASLVLAVAHALPSQAQTPGPTVFEGAHLIVGDGSAIEDASFVVEYNKIDTRDASRRNQPNCGRPVLACWAAAAIAVKMQ